VIGRLLLDDEAVTEVSVLDDQGCTADYDANAAIDILNEFKKTDLVLEDGDYYHALQELLCFREHDRSNRSPEGMRLWLRIMRAKGASANTISNYAQHVVQIYPYLLSVLHTLSRVHDDDCEDCNESDVWVTLSQKQWSLALTLMKRRLGMEHPTVDFDR
jgi:hypothetical protein